jgi:hypothetical protein
VVLMPHNVSRSDLFFPLTQRMGAEEDPLNRRSAYRAVRRGVGLGTIRNVEGRSRSYCGLERNHVLPGLVVVLVGEGVAPGLRRATANPIPTPIPRLTIANTQFGALDFTVDCRTLPKKPEPIVRKKLQHFHDESTETLQDRMHLSPVLKVMLFEAIPADWLFGTTLSWCFLWSALLRRYGTGRDQTEYQKWSS